MRSSSYDYIFKVILAGESGVGKSCLLLQLTGKKTNADHKPTIGGEFGAIVLKVQKRNGVKLHIWDTAGQERFRAITKSFFRGAAGVLLVYDITNRQTFNKLTYWLEEIRQHGNENVTIMLLGNKSDLAAQRAVSFQEGQEFAKEHGLLFMECSAKKNEDVDKAFISTAEKIYVNIKDGIFQPSEFQGIRVTKEANPGPFGKATRGLCCFL